MHRAMHQVMLDELSNCELLGRRHTHARCAEVRGGVSCLRAVVSSFRHTHEVRMFEGEVELARGEPREAQL